MQINLCHHVNAVLTSIEAAVCAMPALEDQLTPHIDTRGIGNHTQPHHKPY